ncbi:hypothetical protein ACFQAT_27485 [Undibacterium arcticum]|uniref:Uncharacterized protein n=1 Tax=Undibacterium arcticum TaxID=1762892 RepID=A0ABV7EYS6_9BURK
MTTFTKAVAVTVITMIFGSAAISAFAADTHWQKKHPRREQVNNRLQNQNRRIHNEVKEGELIRGQAQALHKKDRQIRQEEHAMASRNGGHITKQEQKTLKQQENAVSKQIGK